MAGMTVPTGWTLLDESTNGPLYQLLVYRFATGNEVDASVSFNWSSIDSANDVIVGRIHQFRYIDPDTPIEGLTSPTFGTLSTIALPSVTTVFPNSLATYWVSWSDNVISLGPDGETGGEWVNLGELASTSVGDHAANRRAGAEMAEPGTISGGSISTIPTDSPPSHASLLVGVVLRGLLRQASRERVQPYSDFALVYTAIAGDWSLEHDILKLRIQDLGALLQERLQALTYAGLGDKTGTPDMAGRSRPLCFGHCLNVTAQLVDPSILTFQIHSGSIEAVVAVYDQGVEVPVDDSPGVDYETYEDLALAAISAGTFATCLTEGYFRLGSTPTGTVTADVRGDNADIYVNTHAGIIRRMLLGYSQLTENNLDEDSFDEMDADQPAEIGIFFPAGDQSTIESAIEFVALSANAFAGQDRSGLYRVQLLSVPTTGAPDWAFDDRDIISIEREPLPYRIPWKAWGVGYEKNWTVQESSGLASGVAQARRQFLESEYRYAFATSSTVALSHLTSAGATRNSLFVDAGDAAEEADRLLTFYTRGRAMYRLTVKNALFSVEIGQTVLLTYDRWNLTQGRRHIVMAVADDADTSSTELLVFG